MQTVTLEHAKAHLAELIAQTGRGEEIVITQDDKPIAKLAAAPPRWEAFGLLKGKITFHEGWEETPEEFRPHME